MRGLWRVVQSTRPRLRTLDSSCADKNAQVAGSTSWKASSSSTWAGGAHGTDLGYLLVKDLARLSDHKGCCINLLPPWGMECDGNEACPLHRCRWPSKDVKWIDKWADLEATV